MEITAKITNTVLPFKTRDVLPFTLKLPHAIAAAKTEAELEDIAQLGLSKCDYLHRFIALCHCKHISQIVLSQKIGKQWPS